MRQTTNSIKSTLNSGVYSVASSKSSLTSYDELNISGFYCVITNNYKSFHNTNNTDHNKTRKVLSLVVHGIGLCAIGCNETMRE